MHIIPSALVHLAQQYVPIVQMIVQQLAELALIEVYLTSSVKISL